jgi:glycosyltransferase involved in cell wall biosynthesis
VIVAEGEEEAWVSALDNMLIDEAARAELGRRGRARAESAFAWPIVARQHLAFFEELAR